MGAPTPPLEELYRVARCYLEKHFLEVTPEDCEEFAAYYVIDVMEHNGVNRPFKFAALDYFGHSRMYGSKVTHGPALAHRHYRVDVAASKLLRTYPYDIKSFINLSMILNAKLEKQTRAAMLLYFKWGLKLDEIGQLFGVTRSRTHDWIAAGIRLVKKELAD